MAKITLRERITYWSDRLLGSSFSVQIAVLVFLTLLITGVGTLLAHIVLRSHDYPNEMWWTFLRFIDPGHLDKDDGALRRTLATGVVLSGWVVFGLLISVLSTGMQERLESLRKGAGRIIDENHTIILGWGNTIFSILDQLHSDDEGTQDSIVLLADRDRDEMEIEISKYCLRKKSCKTLVRSGSIESVANLRRMNVAYAKEIIILDDKTDDSEQVPDSKTLKTILAIHQGVATETDNWIRTPLTVVASISTARTRYLLPDHLKNSGPRPIRVIMVETVDILARIIAQCTAQKGLSLVYRDLFSYEGDFHSLKDNDSSEIYCVEIENAQIPSGSSYQDCFFSLGNAIPIGYRCKEEKAVLNPPPDSEAATRSLHAGDLIIAIADRRNDVLWQPQKPITVARNQDGLLTQARKILMVGEGQKIKTVLRELPHYLPHQSVIYTTLKDVPASKKVKIQSIQSKGLDDILENPKTYKLDEIDTVGLISDLQDRDEHDTQILALMMAIRVKSAELDRKPTVVAELLDPRNQELAEAVDVKEIIISTDKVSNYMVQLARDPARAEVFGELFDPQGMEIYLRHTPLYTPKGCKEITFDELAAAAWQRNETLIGYIPLSREMVCLSPRDRKTKKPPSEFVQLVVIAKG